MVLYRGSIPLLRVLNRVHSTHPWGCTLPPLFWVILTGNNEMKYLFSTLFWWNNMSGLYSIISQNFPWIIAVHFWTMNLLDCYNPALQRWEPPLVEGWNFQPKRSKLRNVLWDFWHNALDIGTKAAPPRSRRTMTLWMEDDTGAGLTRRQWVAGPRWPHTNTRGHQPGQCVISQFLIWVARQIRDLNVSRDWERRGVRSPGHNLMQGAQSNPINDGLWQNLRHNQN